MDNESGTQVDSSTSGRRYPRWKYTRLVNEKDLNTNIKPPCKVYIQILLYMTCNNKAKRY